MLIDFHCHVFPEKIVERAINLLSVNAGGIEPNYDGSLNGLKRYMKEQGVDVAVALSIATNAHQMASVNNFAASINNDNIVAFGSVYPDAPDALDELERIKELGLVGVKFHPECQAFCVSDEKMMPIYKKIGELGLITIFHAGGDLGYLPPYGCMPEDAVKVVDLFSSPVVFAHWGAYYYPEKTYEYLAGRNCYFDTSFGYGTVPKPLAEKIVEKHGVDKLLFGSDGPWSNVAREKRYIELLGLSQEEKDLIFHKNAEKLLKL